MGTSNIIIQFIIKQNTLSNVFNCEHISFPWEDEKGQHQSNQHGIYFKGNKGKTSVRQDRVLCFKSMLIYQLEFKMYLTVSQSHDSTFTGLLCWHHYKNF